MKLNDYIYKRATLDCNTSKAIQEYEEEQNRFKEKTLQEIEKLKEKNQLLNGTLDYLLTDIIPKLTDKEV